MVGSKGKSARRTAVPAEAFRIAREDGIAVLTGCDCTTREAAATLATAVFGSALAAVQTPIHVGMNNTGFSGTRRLAHTETRGVHQDQIIQYAWNELPDFFLLACQRPCAQGGGRSTWIDLWDVLDRLERRPETAWIPERLLSEQHPLTHVLTVPPDYQRLAADPGATNVDEVAARFPVAVARPAERVDYFGARLPSGRCFVKHSGRDVRPVPHAVDPERDLSMIHIMQQAVEAAEGKGAADATRSETADTTSLGHVVTQAGDCLVIDNYRCLHGREPYFDTERSMWQMWCWTTEALAVPVDPGPFREWQILPPAKMHRQAQQDHVVTSGSTGSSSKL